MLINLANIHRPNSSRPESITIENGLIKGWNLPPEGEITVSNGATVALAMLELHAHLRESGQEIKGNLHSGRL